MSTLDGWVSLPIRGQLDGIGPEDDIDAAGAYPLTISVRQESVPGLLQQIAKATDATATDEHTRPRPKVLRLFADQLGRAYDGWPLEELEQHEPEKAAEHTCTAEQLWPWLGQLPADLRKAAWSRGWERAIERARKDAAQDTMHIQYATELRIPCPDPADPGRPDHAPHLHPEPLIIRKNTSGYPKGWEDGWLILNPNLEPGDHVWTGREWGYRGELQRNAIYRWTRSEAVTEAQHLAIQETTRFEAWIAETRAKKGSQP